MSDARLPAHVEVSALIRAVQANGGYAAVLAKGERDAGTILVLTIDRHRNGALYERMPQPDGSRNFVVTKKQTPDNKQEFEEYLDRRKRQDGDIWIIEADIADAKRFIDSLNG